MTTGGGPKTEDITGKYCPRVVEVASVCDSDALGGTKKQTCPLRSPRSPRTRKPAGKAAKFVSPVRTANERLLKESLASGNPEVVTRSFASTALAEDEPPTELPRLPVTPQSSIPSFKGVKGLTFGPMKAGFGLRQDSETPPSRAARLYTRAPRINRETTSSEIAEAENESFVVKVNGRENDPFVSLPKISIPSRRSGGPQSWEPGSYTERSWGEEARLRDRSLSSTSAMSLGTLPSSFLINSIDTGSPDSSVPLRYTRGFRPSPANVFLSDRDSQPTAPPMSPSSPLLAARSSLDVTATTRHPSVATSLLSLGLPLPGAPTTCPGVLGSSDTGELAQEEPALMLHWPAVKFALPPRSTDCLEGTGASQPADASAGQGDPRQQHGGCRVQQCDRPGDREGAPNAPEDRPPMGATTEGEGGGGATARCDSFSSLPLVPYVVIGANQVTLDHGSATPVASSPLTDHAVTSKAPAPTLSVSDYSPSPAVFSRHTEPSTTSAEGEPSSARASMEHTEPALSPSSPAREVDTDHHAGLPSDTHTQHLEDASPAPQAPAAQREFPAPAPEVDVRERTSSRPPAPMRIELPGGARACDSNTPGQQQPTCATKAFVELASPASPSCRTAANDAQGGDAWDASASDNARDTPSLPACTTGDAALPTSLAAADAEHSASSLGRASDEAEATLDDTSPRAMSAEASPEPSSFEGSRGLAGRNVPPLDMGYNNSPTSYFSHLSHVLTPVKESPNLAHFSPPFPLSDDGTFSLATPSPRTAGRTAALTLHVSGRPLAPTAASPSLDNFAHSTLAHPPPPPPSSLDSFAHSTLAHPPPPPPPSSLDSLASSALFASELLAQPPRPSLDSLTHTTRTLAPSLDAQLRAQSSEAPAKLPAAVASGAPSSPPLVPSLSLDALHGRLQSLDSLGHAPTTTSAGDAHSRRSSTTHSSAHTPPHSTHSSRSPSAGLSPRSDHHPPHGPQPGQPATLAGQRAASEGQRAASLEDTPWAPQGGTPRAPQPSAGGMPGQRGAARGGTAASSSSPGQPQRGPPDTPGSVATPQRGPPDTPGSVATPGQPQRSTPGSRPTSEGGTSGTARASLSRGTAGQRPPPDTHGSRPTSGGQRPPSEAGQQSEFKPTPPAGAPHQRSPRPPQLSKRRSDADLSVQMSASLQKKLANRRSSIGALTDAEAAAVVASVPSQGSSEQAVGRPAGPKHRGRRASLSGAKASISNGGPDVANVLLPDQAAARPASKSRGTRVSVAGGKISVTSSGEVKEGSRGSTKQHRSQRRSLTLFATPIPHAVLLRRISVDHAPTLPGDSETDDNKHAQHSDLAARRAVSLAVDTSAKANYDSEQGPGEAVESQTDLSRPTEPEATPTLTYCRETLEDLVKAGASRILPPRIQALAREFSLAAKAGVLHKTEFVNLLRARFQKNSGKHVQSPVHESRLQHLNELFHVADTNNDGQVGIVEYVDFMSILIGGSQTERLRLVFNVYDRKGVGELQVDKMLSVSHVDRGDDIYDMVNMVQEVAKAMGAHPKPSPQYRGGSGITWDLFLAAKSELPLLVEVFEQALPVYNTDSVELKKLNFTWSSLRKLWKFINSHGKYEEVDQGQFFTICSDWLGFSNPVAVGRLFDAYDVNRSQTMDLRQLMLCFSDALRGTVVDRLPFYFSLLDVNGSGTIDAVEITRFLDGARAKNPTNVKWVRAFDSTSIMAQMDSNDDGVIDYDEFVAGVTAKPQLLAAIVQNLRRQG